MTPSFVSGQELCRQFYLDAVRPILDQIGLPHSAALLGRGSEVLGFDDEMSGDHNWEPRVLLFLSEENHVRHAEELKRQLPQEFQGRATANEILTLRGYFLKQLDFDLDTDLEPRDWLTFSEQQLRMITAGAVYHDDLGLQAVRDRFAYYPDDVWFYLQVAAWWRVHPELNLVGRAGFVGDELGSSLIGSELCENLMRLCFLLERHYVPYSKWFGTAFSRLECADVMSPLLRQVLRAETWQERETALLAAYEEVASLHNALNITPAVPTQVEQMWNRPFKVLWGDFPGALIAQIQDPAVKQLAERWPTGAIVQVKDLMWPRGTRGRLLEFVGGPGGGVEDGTE